MGHEREGLTTKRDANAVCLPLLLYLALINRHFADDVVTKDSIETFQFFASLNDKI